MQNPRLNMSLATRDISPAAIDTHAYSFLPAAFMKDGGSGGASLADNGGSSDDTT